MKKQGYTFEIALKAILRHNPDIIAVGEIRDKKTAEIALNAAYTGHLVIASLHTNNIESTLLRLENLGCNSFLISYCLRGIISQSLKHENNRVNLLSKILLCKTTYIIKDIKKELHDHKPEYTNRVKEIVDKLLNNEIGIIPHDTVPENYYSRMTTKNALKINQIKKETPKRIYYFNSLIRTYRFTNSINTRINN